jgi:hypothetical protein
MREHSLYNLNSQFHVYEERRGSTSTIAGVTGRPLDAVVRGSERVEPPPVGGPSPGPAKYRYDNTARTTTTRNTAPSNLVVTSVCGLHTFIHDSVVVVDYVRLSVGRQSFDHGKQRNCPRKLWGATKFWRWIATPKFPRTTHF